MGVVLLDTSALIEFWKATESAIHRRVVELVESDAVVAVTEPVVMEFLAGQRGTEAEQHARELMISFELLVFDAAVDFEDASFIYRRCRGEGITPRDLIDCMIASVAIRHDAAVLSADLDFGRIATVVDLRLDSATPRE